MSKSLDGLRVCGDVDEHRHTQENALGAAALFGRWLARRQGGTHATYRTGFRVRRRFHVLCGFHSSSPQKSISGATSSTPYSHPSGRWLPFHTIMAALLVSVARLLRARRCSRSSDSARTNMQPYGLTTRVCPSTVMRFPDSSSHSRRTGTREFIRRPRRFSWCREPRRLDSRSFTVIFASTTPC